LDHSQGYQFDELLHLPGISPYFDALGFGLEHRVPDGCNVIAASYLIRHAAIYANDGDYETYIEPFLQKLDRNRAGWTGPLKFLTTWESPIPPDKLEEITPPGTSDAVKVGKHLLEHYPDLVPTTKRILADKKSRTFDTAKAFVKAFPNAEDIEVVRVRQDVNGSKDALIPHKNCPAFSKEPGNAELADFIASYAPSISARLAPFTPFELSDNDVVGLQQLCGYESGINGKRSPICAIFQDAEWMAYEYAFDLKYAHMVGPLNPLSPYLGLPWLKAQTQIFSKLNGSGSAAHSGGHGDGDGSDKDGWPDAQRLFLGFTHREVPPFVATALGLFNSSSSEREEFPTDHINWTRAWKMADLIPFLGHVGMEMMSCDGSTAMQGEYVRVIANTAPRPIPKCQSGPGASCPMEEFEALIAEKDEKWGDFHKMCDVGEK